MKSLLLIPLMAGAAHAASIQFSGGIESFQGMVEIGGDLMNLEVVTQDVFDLQVTPSMTFSITVSTLNSEALDLRIFPSLPGSTSFMIDPASILGPQEMRTYVWNLPPFDPDPDATNLPSLLYLIVSTERSDSGLFYGGPTRNGMFSNPSYSLTFEGFSSIAAREGVIVPPSAPGEAPTYVASPSLLTPVPEPTGGLLAGFALSAFVVRRQRRNTVPQHTFKQI